MNSRVTSREGCTAASSGSGYTASIAVCPEAFDAAVHPYLDVTRLFIECNLPVPQVLDVDAPAGINVQEDLGHLQLCHVFDGVSADERQALLEQEIVLIARLHAATRNAYR